MKILVINAGSSSLKYRLFDMDGEKVLAKGICERISMDGAVLKHEPAGGERIVLRRDMPSHNEAAELVLDMLVDKKLGVIKDVSEIAAVGHRILHGGEDFKESVIVDEEVMAKCRKNIELGPLHMPGNISCVDACRRIMPDVPHVLVFDTTFHSTMPPKAYMYAIPYELYEKYKVRKYGFHGTSHQYIAGEAARLFGKGKRFIICHLGSGSSISAVKDGVCLDTTMGFTPLEGLMMGTRSGNIDPAAIGYLGRKLGKSLDEMVSFLNKECGLLGVSGVSNDNRDVTKAMFEGNPRAKLAMDMHEYQIVKFIGSYVAVLGGVDAIIFTGGIGENSAETREAVLKALSFIGIDFDEDANRNAERGTYKIITKPGSKVISAIIPTDEEVIIARETDRLAKGVLR